MDAAIVLETRKATLLDFKMPVRRRSGVNVYRLQIVKMKGMLR